MTKIEDAAFPSENGRGWYHGMSLRDYFAAKVMQASLSSPEFMVIVTADEALGENARQRISKISYKYADAMLEERNKNV